MSDMVPMYGFGGGGGTGATLTVTAPAGTTVTVSKDGKTKTKVAGADGAAVFKGLASGEWAVTITDGVQTSAPKTVTITADYSTAISFFAATINITYPAGSICTATDGVTTLIAPDTSGTWECVVPNAGDWVFSLNSGFRETVSITENGQTEILNQWYIYNNGTESFDIVPCNPVSDTSITSIGVTKNVNHINLLNTTSSVRGSGVYAIVDLTGFTKLCIEITASGDYLNNGLLYVAPDTNPLSGKAVATKGFSACSSKTIYTLDVSEISGMYACCFGEWSNKYNIQIYRMWCE